MNPDKLPSNITDGNEYSGATRQDYTTKYGDAAITSIQTESSSSSSTGPTRRAKRILSNGAESAKKRRTQFPQSESGDDEEPEAAEDESIEDESVARVKVNLEDVSCPMCKEILCEPISLPCGHTFCRVCLYRCFHARTYEKVCPLCRAQCVRIVAQIAPSNVLIKMFTEQAFPAAYRKRREEFKLIIDQWPAPLFIYFSSHFILPYQSVTITFTEKRYIEMIRRLSKPATSSTATTPIAESAFLLLPPAQMKRGDIGIVVVIESVTWKSGNSEAECRVRADRRCKVMDCWLTDVVDGLHSAQIEPFGDVQDATANTTDSTSAQSAPTAATTQTAAAESTTTSIVAAVGTGESRSTQIKKWMDKLLAHMSDADDLSQKQFTGRKNMGPPPTDATEMSWWIFRALAFDGAGLQARVPIFLTSSILHSRDPLWRLQVAVQLMQQLLTKLRGSPFANSPQNAGSNDGVSSSSYVNDAAAE